MMTGRFASVPVLFERLFKRDAQVGASAVLAAHQKVYCRGNGSLIGIAGAICEPPRAVVEETERE